tara:strand:- start:104 stop:520 length:417 start_codon:yes stop_codon:yes gene_type:complete
MRKKIAEFFGGKIVDTIKSFKPNVGNLKFNQDTKNKLIKTTDAYVTKAGKVDPGLKKALRDAGSKSLQGDKIVRKRNKKSKEMFKTAEGKKDGGRMGLKFGGGANLKDIPAGKKFDGLRKLPKEVRNKMKYKKDGGKI